MYTGQRTPSSRNATLSKEQMIHGRYGQLGFSGPGGSTTLTVGGPANTRTPRGPFCPRKFLDNLTPDDVGPIKQFGQRFPLPRNDRHPNRVGMRGGLLVRADGGNFKYTGLGMGGFDELSVIIFGHRRSPVPVGGRNPFQKGLSAFSSRVPHSPSNG